MIFKLCNQYLQMLFTTNIVLQYITTMMGEPQCLCVFKVKTEKRMSAKYLRLNLPDKTAREAQS